MTALRQRCYRTLFAPEQFWQRMLSSALALLIVLNVAGIMLETMPAFAEDAQWSMGLLWLERVSVSVFIIEYLLRGWCIVESPDYRGAVAGRLRYSISFFAVLDLLAILPAILPFLLGIDLRMLRLMRVLRILAFLRLGRYSAGLRLFGQVLIAKRGELGAMLLLVLVLLLLASSTMYYIEHEAQPEVFDSIPGSLWWGIITLTTVGYGDATPLTPLGRVLGGLIALLGIGIAAMPAGILASGLYQAIASRGGIEEENEAPPNPTDQDPT